MGTFVICAGVNNLRQTSEEINNEYRNFEIKLTTEFRRQLVEKLIDLQILKTYKKDIDRKWTFYHEGNSNIALDIHFNISKQSYANGVEVVVPFSVKKSVFAFEISSIISKVLNISNRGIKNEITSYGKHIIFVEEGFENVTIEICFLSNKNDINSYIKNKDILINKLANYLKLKL